MPIKFLPVLPLVERGRWAGVYDKVLNPLLRLLKLFGEANKQMKMRFIKLNTTLCLFRHNIVPILCSPPLLAYAILSYLLCIDIDRVFA